jgi:hypothetical protein
MSYQRPSPKEFIDRMCQDSDFPIQKHHIKFMGEVIKALEDKDSRMIIMMPRRIGRTYLMEKARHLKFWKTINSLLEHFQSLHPYDKNIIQELLKGGMTKDEVTQLRELLLKAAKAYYGKS